MPKPISPKVRGAVPASRMLRASEYPPHLAGRSEVRFVGVSPLGTYHVEHHGAGVHVAYFTPRRRGSRSRSVGGAASVAGALRRVSEHEDELLHPGAPRERDALRPVSVRAVGVRTGAPRPPSDLDREIGAWLATNPEHQRARVEP